MNIEEFNYHLPKELVAQAPTQPRDHSRLLVLDKKTGMTEHHTFYEIIDFLKAGDLLILNNSKVFPARLIGEKLTGGRIEMLLNREIKDGVWEVIGKNLKNGGEIIFKDSKLRGKILNKNNQMAEVRFNIEGENFFNEIKKIGLTPLPPYIKRKANKSDLENYQTVYAKNRGSVAAPTAGLHFTPKLLKKIKAKGVKIFELTLHVGLGTFAPVKVEEISKHKMHKEYYSIKKETIAEILKAKKEKRRIIAVGTTTTRVLEHIFNTPAFRLLTTSFSGWTGIYIYPPYKFKCVDAVITNFHLPKSTLLLLVSAFAGKSNIKKAYQEAIDNKYRFFSYGDAMFIK